MKSHPFLLFVLLIVCEPVLMKTHAQNMGIYNNETVELQGPNHTTPSTGMNRYIILNQMSQFSDYSVKRGHVMIRSNFGTDYQLGDGTITPAFTIEISFKLGLYDVFSSHLLQFVNRTFTVTNANPEGLFYFNLADHINDAASLGTGLDIVAVTIEDLHVNDISAVPVPTAITALRVWMESEIEYGITADPFINGFNSITIGSTNSPKRLNFRWNSNKLYPNYQFQLVRLFNHGEDTYGPLDPKLIDLAYPGNPQLSGINWNEALTLETGSADNTLDLTISEGTGGYAWRVRPIGTLYEGGIADSRNYGDWSYSEINPSNQVVNFTGNPSQNTPSHKWLFWFDDPDENKNLIYSRIFTEGNKTSEKVSYANSLLQMRQTQTLLNSTDIFAPEGTVLVTQSILDYSGRSALTTIPVPTGQTLSGYRENLVKEEISGNLYTADQFDNDQNFRNPGTIDDNDEFKYYSDGNSLSTIPDAENYPYSRTLFENDGSGRIKEQSGIGKTHMIGQQSQGMGRTTRTYYGVPSQQELNDMFGVEAPKSDNVFKTVTVDPNNTASISYTNKEGQVIATCLTFDETGTGTETLGSLYDQDAEGKQQTITDDITHNIKDHGEIKSSKRLVIMSPTSVGLNYQITQEVIQNTCTDVELKCGFAVKVLIHNLDDNTTTTYGPEILDCNITDPDVTCSPGPSNTIITANLGLAQLQPGNYLIEKILYKAGPSNATVTYAMDRIKMQIDPIKNWITSTLEQVNCEEELMIFYNDLNYFANHLGDPQMVFGPTNCDGCSGTTYDDFPAEFLAMYNPTDFDVWIDPAPVSSNLPYTTSSDELPQYVYIRTPCCGIMKISVMYKPPFKCPTMDQLNDFKNTLEGSPDPSSFVMSTYKVNFDLLMNPNPGGTDTYFLPDFEGYAVSMMKQCFEGHMSSIDAEETARDVLYSNMRGWQQQGMFNMMVYHMLADQYNCENLVNGCSAPNCSYTSPTPPASPTTGYNSLCEPGSDPIYPCTHYRCTDLAKCWRGLVLMLMNAYCPQEDLDYDSQTNGRISEGVDEQNEEDTEVHDNHVDNNFDINLPRPFKDFLDYAMSLRLRDKQDISAQTNGPMTIPRADFKINLVEEFLLCTGYQFADILNNSSGTGVNSPETNNAPPTGADCFQSLNYDFDGDVNNGHYDPAFYFNNDPGVWKLADLLPGMADNTVLFPNLVSVPFPDLLPDWQEMQAIDYGPNQTDEFELNELGKRFFNIKNPIYAFKYFEYNYGEHNDLEITNCFRDPNKCYLPNGNGTYSLVDCCYPDPCYFCSIGYINCPLTKENWNCGQRFTWYNLIKNFNSSEEPDIAGGIDNDCTRMAQITEWYEDDQGGNHEPIYQFLTEDEYRVFYPTAPWPPSSTVGPKKFTGIDGTPNQTSISIVEREAVAAKDRCNSGCNSDTRKSEFRRKLIEVFTERCYIIGGCKVNEDDNVVPEEDIDFLVDQLVLQCQSQCTMTTYSCLEQGCRSLDTDPYDQTHIGATWATTDETTFKLGVGGVYDFNGSPSTTLHQNLTNSMLQCTETPTDPFTYAQHTLWKQAMDWDFEIDIVSKCNVVSPLVNPTEAHFDILQPLTNVYIFDEELGYFVVQNMTQCLIQNIEPWKDVRNTALPRSEFAVNPAQIPFDHNTMGTPGTPVKSEKVLINATTPQ